MGLLSPSLSLARYAVQGKIDGPVIETVRNGLQKQSFREIDDRPVKQSSGWTSFETPYSPNFENSSFIIGTYIVFALRIDKKNVPAKLFKKHYTIEMKKRLIKAGREYLSKDEKEMTKDYVLNSLLMRMPATPNICDVIWNYEESYAWFFSGTKTANEQFETSFSESFNLAAVRLFPYTEADLVANLNESERDLLLKLEPTKFMG